MDGSESETDAQVLQEVIEMLQRGSIRKDKGSRGWGYQMCKSLNVSTYLQSSLLLQVVANTDHDAMTS